MSSRINNFSFGAGAGLLAFLLGGLVVYLWYRANVNPAYAGAFFKSMAGSTRFASNVCMLSIIPNPFLFFFFLQKDLDRAAGGLLSVTLLITLGIVILRTI